ncbi:MAG: thiol-disulfide isomerase/thioredoxin [Gammaproteobacteria bacterium]|jgi:thiol-disulfide isomerase/thioredoxin
MKNIALVSFMIVITSTVILQDMTQAAGGVLTSPIQAPEFTHNAKQDWINSEPLSIKDLHGKVVLVDFWTFGCWNCYRSFPWMNAMENRLDKEKFQVIGVHTPEFESEKIMESIVAKAKEFELHHPIMIDNNSSYWRAMNNRYWPAYYILDKKGNVRTTFFGETHEGDNRAKQIENVINQLIAESS